jgi:DNA gyrase/topoisomerase IV subunit A
VVVTFHDVGWSTSIPSYNPKDIVRNIRRLIAGEEQEPMLPWWRGFKGTIKKTGEHKYDVTGIATKLNDTTIEITELPIHKWTQTYKAELEAMIGEKGDGVVKVRALPLFRRGERQRVLSLPTGLQGTSRQPQRALRHQHGGEGRRESRTAGPDGVLQIDE